MNENSTEATFDLAFEAYNEGASDSLTPQKAQEIELIALIDNLPYLNDLDKYWARSDTEKQLDNIEIEKLPGKIAELKKKFQFYNFAGQLRSDICKRAQGANGETVCDLIDTSILTVSSEGKDRKWKLKELMILDKATQELKTEQDLTKFTQRLDGVKYSVTSKILMLFDAEFAEKFKNFQEEMGAPRFWDLSREMSPADFPNFTTTFNFRAPRDFLKKLSQKSLPAWPDKLRKSLMNDAKEMLFSEVFNCSRDSEFRAIKNAKTIADVISKLLDLKTFRDIEQQNLDRIKKVEEKNKKQKDLDLVKLEREKKEFEERGRYKESKESETKKKKEQEEKKKNEKEEREKKVDVGAELSIEKQQILRFYEKSIEHAEKVIAECPGWGVDPNDIDYWGREGVKNRTKSLRDKNKWNDYVKFNSNDPNIPSNARGDGFRFRWLNANTGSRISGAGAEAGTKYMQRYKESGYMLCVLAGGFSVNWSGPDSPAYTPVEFLSKMQSMKSELLGGNIKKKKK